MEQRDINLQMEKLYLYKLYNYMINEINLNFNFKIQGFRVISVEKDNIVLFEYPVNIKMTPTNITYSPKLNSRSIVHCTYSKLWKYRNELILLKKIMEDYDV